MRLWRNTEEPMTTKLASKHTSESTTRTLPPRDDDRVRGGSTLVGLSTNNGLVSFDSASPERKP